MCWHNMSRHAVLAWHSLCAFHHCLCKLFQGTSWDACDPDTVDTTLLNDLVTLSGLCLASEPGLLWLDGADDALLRMSALQSAGDGACAAYAECVALCASC